MYFKTFSLISRNAKFLRMYSVVRPTGALLSALLGQLEVPNVVLEREPEITTDPRGIALDEDGIRCIQAAGMYDRIHSQIALCHKMFFISAFLVGADGKTGTNYEETWVALNWHITLPTPKTHPDFPLWQLGYTPEDVYDAFFPPNFRFLCNPARPSVCGRFGLPGDRLWRFEFVVGSAEDPARMATDEETSKIIHPYITHPGSKYGLRHDIRFPTDCIETLRSRPFNFLARSCNYWALNRVLIVGDAAHVFPPFGGQGITSGFRDATGLAWRLCHLYRNPKTDHQKLLRGWYLERKQQLEHSLAATIRNGEFVTNSNFFKAFFRDWVLWAMQLVPSWKRRTDKAGRATTRYHHLPGLPFLPEYGGGVNLAQVYARPLDGPADAVTFTDDLIFGRNKKGIVQLLIIVDKASQVGIAVEEAEGVPELFGDLVREGEATLLVNDLAATSNDVHGRRGWIVARVASGDEFAREKKLCGSRPSPANYNAWRIRDELKANAKYVLVRADKFVFAACINREELEVALLSLPECLHGH
ncbi:hypothetical protein B0A55_12547 [Friedmanniomyces simplex]|uniref:FAD-binding domain-containing protein n=1 Tax=Friedmanniomyces simplex TaxID=329884 RepID=A0A4V5NCV6_9PEZI|nr:hypothetical protein B0A55_12547 [Friedmanniomyces simplex]